MLLLINGQAAFWITAGNHGDVEFKRPNELIVREKQINDDKSRLRSHREPKPRSIDAIKT